MRIPSLEVDLVVVDEASMVNGPLLRDLLSFGKKVLAVGDHGQLEPIGENPGLMNDPEILLEQIHRQARDSAILRFAHAVRKGESPRQWIGYERFDICILGGLPETPEQYDVLICGYNRTRVSLNDQVRQARGHHDRNPQPGEWVICLKNNADFGIFNGQRFQVASASGSIDEDDLALELVDEDGNKFPAIPVEPDQFGQEKTPEWSPPDRGLFDWGYAITAHKSQGSEHRKVAVVEELHMSWSASRWRYTASTRASECLHYFVR